jgi:transcription elongation GreA/GreB family factor
MHTRELTSSHCVTCEVELTDEVVRLSDGRPGVPISASAFADIQQRLSEVSGDIDVLLPDAHAHAAEGIAHAGFYLLVRRQHHLRGLLDRAVVMVPDGRALLGSIVTVRQSDGSHDRLALVTPVDADPSAGRVSIDAPIGAALLGRRVGDVVSVHAPSGLRDLTVVAVGA